MPLIFDKFSIKTINGPTHMNVLIPNETNIHINKSTILLFGETHNLLNYRPCDNPDCSELQLDFIERLDKFAKYFRTEFYFEKFFNTREEFSLDENKIKYYKKHYKEKRDAVYKLRNNPNSSILHNRSIKQNLLFQGERSILTEFNNLYEGCFNKNLSNIKDLCPYNNIIWQYADARKTYYYTKKTRDYSNFLEAETHPMFMLFMKLFYIKRGGVLLDNNRKLMTLDDREFEGFRYSYDKDSPNIITEKDLLAFDEEMENSNARWNALPFLEMLLVALTDVDQYITNLLDVRIIKKQLNKMKPEVKEIFTKQSFIDLFIWYKRFLYGPEDYKNIDKYDILEKMKKLIKLSLDYYREDNKLKKEQIIESINNIPNFTEHELMKSEYSLFAIGASTLDIYFILRINKEYKDPRLILGFFGSNHVLGITHYFTEIVKTHYLAHSYTNKINSIGTKDAKIEIPDTDIINLNEITGAEVPNTSDSSSRELIVHPKFPLSEGGEKRKKKNISKQTKKKRRINRRKSTKRFIAF